MANNKNLTNYDNPEINEVINWLIQSGHLADKTISDVDIRVANAERKQRLFHNTQLLLKHYREIIWILESFPSEVAEELQEPIQDLDQIIERLGHDVELETSEHLDRLKSITKSRKLVELVHRAMMTLKKKPHDGEKLYYVVYYKYFYKDRLSTNEILDKIREKSKDHEAMSERTYYNHKEKAIKILSLCLWSSPNKELESWINLAIMLKSSNK